MGGTEGRCWPVCYQCGKTWSSPTVGRVEGAVRVDGLQVHVMCMVAELGS